jgi:hypothetical protein
MNLGRSYFREDDGSQPLDDALQGDSLEDGLEEPGNDRPFRILFGKRSRSQVE